MSTAPPPERPDEESGEPAALSDEQWETFLRDAAEGGATGAPKEPSARARMVTRRLRDEAEARARAEGRPGRTARSGRARGRDRTARAATPPGRRTGPALHPAFAGDRSSGAPATGPVQDPYDRSRELTDDSSDCNRLSRT
ncbi:hypothetical protein [Streptomyces collinus]|uniref:hypothetical protein n=1 Tax=Streptomyces collinus TaxID=42684 RepID=UPI00369CA9EE